VDRDQRRSQRVKKRTQVDYGTDDALSPGIGLDISTGGIFVTANKLLPVGTRLHMKVTHGSFVFYAEGRVVRHKLVHMALRTQDPQGMGVRFLAPFEYLEGFVGTVKKGPVPFHVTCATAATMETLIRDQLARGVIIVPTGDTPPEPQETVEFHVTLEFLHDPQTLDGKGRVVQVLNPHNRDTRGAVLQLDDTAPMIAALRRAMGP
jgi:hypothetical protein